MSELCVQLRSVGAHVGDGDEGEDSLNGVFSLRPSSRTWWRDDARSTLGEGIGGPDEGFPAVSR